MNVNQGDGADLFGTIGGIALSAESAPNSREWDGRDSGLVIADIGAPGARHHVRASAPPPPAETAVARRQPDAAIPDADPVGIAHAITIAESGTVARIRSAVNITHTYIGDLSRGAAARRRPPRRAARAARRVDRRSGDDLRLRLTPASSPRMVGPADAGRLGADVADRVGQDVGVLKSWRLELTSVAVGVAAPVRTERQPAKTARPAAALRIGGMPSTAAAAAARRARQGHASAALTDRARERDVSGRSGERPER